MRDLDTCKRALDEQWTNNANTLLAQYDLGVEVRVFVGNGATLRMEFFLRDQQQLAPKGLVHSGTNVPSTTGATYMPVPTNAHAPIGSDQRVFPMQPQRQMRTVAVQVSTCLCHDPLTFNESVSFYLVFDHHLTY